MSTSLSTSLSPRQDDTGPMPDDIEEVPDFRRKSSLGVALTALVVLTPFSVYNFLQGRVIFGVGSLAIVIALTINAWSIRHGRYHPIFTLFGLVPAMTGFLSYTVLNQNMVGVMWCYPVVLSYYFMLPERMAWAANTFLLALVLPATWLAIDHALALRAVATLLATSAFSAIFIRVISVQQKRMHALAVTDPLTGLSNRTLFDATIEQAVAQYRRTSMPMTLVSLDLDHFKAINDTLGHSAGDGVLREMGELMRKRVRRSDKAFRMGGEEFLVLLYNTDAENGRRYAEELRGAVEGHSFLAAQTVTASLGVATLRPEEEVKAWMKRADDNLYRAKEQGRNRVEA